MLGLERSSLIGKLFSRFIQREDQDEFYHHYNMLFKTKGKQICELKLVKNDGSRFFAQLESIIVRDPNGDNTQIRTSIIDIDTRKLTETALKEKDEQLRIAVEGGRLGTWSWNLINHEVIWNSYLYELLGRDPNGSPITEEAFFT